MRNQRQSRVPLKFEDIVHNINNSKQNKQKTASKKKSSSKEYKNNKDSVEGDGESSMNLGSTREEGEVISDNVDEEALNDGGIYKERVRDPRRSDQSRRYELKVAEKSSI
ncbi:hypothetical protein Tco_1359107 [Tanacetum coccineum]